MMSCKHVQRIAHFHKWKLEGQSHGSYFSSIHFLGSVPGAIKAHMLQQSSFLVLRVVSYKATCAMHEKTFGYTSVGSCYSNIVDS